MDRFRDSRADVPTGELLREALDEGRALVKTEIALAKDEVRREARGFIKSAVAFGAAAVLVLFALANVLIGWAIAISPRAWPAFLVAGIFMVGAVVAVLLGRASVPKEPLHETRDRLETDLHVLKETTA